jgi:hypothetical protein
MQELHRVILELKPACKLWFLDGKDSDKGKTVSNPNIGYGLQTMTICGWKNQRVLPNWFKCKYHWNLRLHHWVIDDKTYLSQNFW